MGVVVRHINNRSSAARIIEIEGDAQFQRYQDGELSRGRMILLGPGEDAEVAFYTIDHTYDILPFKVCGKRWKMKGYGEIHVEHQRLRFGVGGPESHTQAIYLDFYPIDEERVRSAQEIRDYHGICVNRMGHDYGIHGKQVLGDITFVDP